MDGLVRAARLFARMGQATARGYDPKTVGHILADGRRDMGFLLQGGRHFSEIDERERRALAGMRIVSVSLHAAAGLWMPIATALGVLLAARGMLSPEGLWMLVLLPAAVGYLFGTVVGATEDSRVRRARSRWYRQPWARDLVAEEIAAWRAGSGDADADRVVVTSSGSRVLRGLSVALAAASVAVAIPVLTLIPTSAIGPVVASVGMPRFSATQRRIAEAEGYRHMRIPMDDVLDPQRAGAVLQTLAYVGEARQPSRGEKEPEERFSDPWLPEGGEEAIGEAAHLWQEMAFQSVRDGWSEAARGYAAGVAGHPARELFSGLARARRLDVVSGRWETTLPSDLSLASLPVPRLTAVRTAAWSHVLAAAWELDQGRPERAEERVREVIGLGLLMSDDAPTLIDNLIGVVIARNGAIALRSLHAALGRDAEVEEMERLEDAADRIASRLPLVRGEGTEWFVGALPEMTLDQGNPRGLRWEYFGLVTTLAPCLNLHRMVFGPGEDFDAFIAEAHEALVEWPSEEGLFTIARGGFLRAESESSGVLGRLLSVAMNSNPGSCGRVVRNLDGLRAVMDMR